MPEGIEQREIGVGDEIEQQIDTRVAQRRDRGRRCVGQQPAQRLDQRHELRVEDGAFLEIDHAMARACVKAGAAPRELKLCATPRASRQTFELRDRLRSHVPPRQRRAEPLLLRGEIRLIAQMLQRAAAARPEMGALRRGARGARRGQLDQLAAATGAEPSPEPRLDNIARRGERQIDGLAPIMGDAVAARADALHGEHDRLNVWHGSGIQHCLRVRAAGFR